MRWRSDASMGRCSGTSRIYWVCKYSKPLAMKKEVVNKKTRPRYGESAENCKRDNMLEQLSSPYPWTHKNGAVIIYRIQEFVES